MLTDSTTWNLLESWGFGLDLDLLGFWNWLGFGLDLLGFWVFGFVEVLGFGICLGFGFLDLLGFWVFGFVEVLGFGICLGFGFLDLLGFWVLEFDPKVLFGIKVLLQIEHYVALSQSKCNCQCRINLKKHKPVTNIKNSFITSFDMIYY